MNSYWTTHDHGRCQKKRDGTFNKVVENYAKNHIHESSRLSINFPVLRRSAATVASENGASSQVVKSAVFCAE